jgi:hypothetical protein
MPFLSNIPASVFDSASAVGLAAAVVVVIVIVVVVVAAAAVIAVAVAVVAAAVIAAVRDAFFTVTATGGISTARSTAPGRTGGWRGKWCCDGDGGLYFGFGAARLLWAKHRRGRGSETWTALEHGCADSH